MTGEFSAGEEYPDTFAGVHIEDDPGEEFCRKIELPRENQNAPRSVELKYGYHGDISLTFWEGDLDSKNDGASNTKRFRFRHGGELPLIGSIAGYYRRLKVPHQEAVRDFRYAARSVLAESSELASPYESDSFAVRYAADAYKGEEIPVYDIDELGWKALNDPITTVPGDLDRTGGTGMYSCTDQNGNLQFILGHVLSESEEQDPKISEAELMNIELDRTEVLAIVELLCELSMGEYRREIYEFIEMVFPES